MEALRASHKMSDVCLSSVFVFAVAFGVYERALGPRYLPYLVTAHDVDVTTLSLRVLNMSLLVVMNPFLSYWISQTTRR